MDTSNIKRLAELQQKKKDLEDYLEVLKRDMKELEAEVMQAFLDEGLQKFTVTIKTESGDTVDRTLYLHRQIWAGYHQNETGDGKAQLTQSLEHEGLSDLVRKDFNTQKLSAWLREYDEDNDDPDTIRAKLPESIQDKIKISEVYQIKSRSN